MASKSSSSPLRYATPGQMIFCVILFFLPWVELQCNTQKEKGGFGPQPGQKGTIKIDPPKTAPTWMTIVTQSGMQVASGDATVLGNQPMGDKGVGGPGPGPEKESGSAPLLWLYPLAAIGAIAVGFAMPSTKVRKLALAGCCGLAFLVAAGQAAMGFPIENSIDKSMKEMAGIGGGMPDPITNPGGKKGEVKVDIKKQMDEALKDAFRVNYKFWFYLALLVPIGGLVTALIEPVGPGRGKKKPINDLDDDDDRDDDDDDDRPRKRRRRDDDDDDEDDAPRQRRKKRDDDEEEDDRPKKRKPRDDDDEEEPKPRRRRERDEVEEDEPKPRREEKPGKSDKGKGGKPPPPDSDNPFSNFG